MPGTWVRDTNEPEPLENAVLMGDQKLREKMRRSPAGWRLRELHKLYRSYGFHRREGSKHVIYHHPDRPQLRATVARHDPLRSVYVRDALDLIDRLEAAGGVW